jgi:hypothetical protein
MTPSIDQYVKCFLRSSMMLEGFVVEWSDAQVVLRSDNEDILILHHPSEDIILTKILVSPPQPITPETINETQQEIRQTLHQTLQPNAMEEPKLQQTRLQKLRQLAVQQDKEIIAQKTKEHFGNGQGRAAPYSFATMPITNKRG